MWISIYLVTTVFVLITGQSSEDFTTYTEPYSQNPSTVNFNDIYNNRMPNDNYVTDNLNTISPQFFGFHTRSLQISPIIPRFPNASKKQDTTDYVSTTEETEQVKVIPMRKHHRGVLDILFPAARVKTFKNIFDTFRRVLSHTFKK